MSVRIREFPLGFLVRVPSAFLARPRLGIASQARGARSCGSRPFFLGHRRLSRAIQLGVLSSWCLRVASSMRRKQHRHPPGIKSFLPKRIPGFSRTQDIREIQLVEQIQQEIHLTVIRESFTRRRWKQGRLLRILGAESLGHEPILPSRSIAATEICADSAALV